MPVNVIGDKLLSDIRETISLVRNTPGAEGVARVETRFEHLRQPVMRICTFTGAWSKNAAKTVTFKYQTSSPNTASATNLFATIATAAGSRNCAIAREGTAWFLIAAEC